MAAASSSFTNEEYFTKIASIQQSLHEREKRRLELEKELFSYSMSDKRISQIKSAKLRSYLQEICERETRAKMRNLELLRDADHIEARMKDQACDRAPLHRRKAECMNQITRFMTARKHKELKEYGMKEVEGAREKTQDDSSSARRPAAVTFTDHPRASSSSGGGSSPSATRVQHSGRATHRGSPDRLLVAQQQPSPKRLQPPSGLLKDSKVSGEEAAAATADRAAARLSDDISGSNGSPGSSLSDNHERRRRRAAPVLLLLPTAVPFRACDDEQSLSPPVTLTTRPERNSVSSPGGDATTSPAWDERSGDAPHQPQKPHATTEEEERGLRCCRSERRESVVSPASSTVSVSSDSDLSISLTESESELDHDDDDDEEAEPPEGVAHLDTPPDDARVTPERSASPPPCSAIVTPERSASSSPLDDQSLRCREEESSVQESKNPLQSICDSTTPTESMTERLSHQGLVRLLDSIEGRLHDGTEHVHIYQKPALHARKRNHIISLCNSGAAALHGEDLTACGAVVLGELPRLSRSTTSGALLTQDLVSVSVSAARREDISASLPPDGAALWERWFEHALVLKERRVLTAERLALLFTPLLLERHAAYGQQARELLRTLLSRSAEEDEDEDEEEEEKRESERSPSADEEESDSSSPSRRLPSLHPEHGVERHPAASLAHRPTIQELQSSEEDSRNQSPAESIPIRETKAYQLLKQSATQERERSSGEQEEKSAPSGINGGDEEDLHSSHQDPPQPREETTNSKRISAIQSKAFWGESDDSDSEIEAALRPQNVNANDHDHDFDDFYD